MGQAFTAMFAFFTAMFSALENFASGLNNLSIWVNEASGTFADVARHERNEKLKEMLEEAGIEELPKAAPKSITNGKRLAKAKAPQSKAPVTE